MKSLISRFAHAVVYGGIGLLCVASVARVGWSQSAAPAGACPTGTALMAGGTFTMGEPDGHGAADQHPQHQVTLSPFCIDRTEVTVARYAACVAAGNCAAAPTAPQRETGSSQSVDARLRTSIEAQHPHGAASAADLEARFGNDYCNAARPDRQDHPINCIDWQLARTYCEWAGGRLATEAEWEFAARGADNRHFPWGNAPPMPGLANVCRGECTAAASRPGHPAMSQFTGTDSAIGTQTVGRFLAGSTRAGVLDMAGNVAEWVSDFYGTYPDAPATNPTGAVLGTGRVVRGGGWTATQPEQVAVTTRVVEASNTRAIDIGFRCVRPAAH